MDVMPLAITPLETYCALLAPVVILPCLLFRRSRAGLLVLLLYVVVYIQLSLAGSYVFANEGGSLWVNIWCPKHLMHPYQWVRPTVQPTIPGMLYWPCMLIDQWLWHPTQIVDF